MILTLLERTITEEISNDAVLMSYTKLNLDWISCQMPAFDTSVIDSERTWIVNTENRKKFLIRAYSEVAVPRLLMRNGNLLRDLEP